MVACIKLLQPDRSICVVIPFEAVLAGSEVIYNEVDCPLLVLTKDIYFLSPFDLLSPVSVIHECSESCKFVYDDPFRLVERESVKVSNRCVFFHDWNNDMFCLNVFCMQK